MNRIEKIKEDLNIFETTTLADIEYLLSLNERMKLALEAIGTYKAGDESLHVQTLKEVAVKALEE